MSESLTEVPSAGAIVIFDFDRYHACPVAMTKRRPAVVLGVRGTRALIVPLSQSRPYSSEEPYVELKFHLRDDVRSYAKIMMLESVPLADLYKPYCKDLGRYDVPTITEDDLAALREAVRTVATTQNAA